MRPFHSMGNSLLLKRHATINNQAATGEPGINPRAIKNIPVCVLNSLGKIIIIYIILYSFYSNYIICFPLFFINYITQKHFKYKS